jgi:hypothetical protein
VSAGRDWLNVIWRTVLCGSFFKCATPSVAAPSVPPRSSATPHPACAIDVQAHLAFSLALCGYDVAVYDRSMKEWCGDATRELVATPKALEMEAAAIA